MTGGHRSIGEVLSLLSAEHPGLTISKIRYLESQGLIAPQRAPSGYRKFVDADIVRLDWVLTQQREHFLPLSEIKRRIASGDLQPATPKRTRRGEPAAAMPSLFASKPRRGRRDGAAAPGSQTATAGIEGSVSLSLADLAHATGATVEFVAEIQRIGIIAPVAPVAPHAEPIFDHEALLTASTAAALASHGLPARSLRMFRVASDREAGIYEQVLAARSARGDTAGLRAELSEIVELAETLRQQILRRLLRPHTG